MKKLFLMALVAFMSLQCAAQISKINTTPNKYDFEFYGSLTLYKDWKSGDTIYSIMVNSSNEFEETTAWLKLGNRSNTKKSIKNLLDAYDKPNSSFVLQGYSMTVDDSYYITVSKTGKLKYTAGEYYIYKDYLCDMYNRFCEQTYVGYKTTQDRIYIFSKPQSKYLVNKSEYWSNTEGIPTLKLYSYRDELKIDAEGKFKNGYSSIGVTSKLYVNDTIIRTKSLYKGQKNYGDMMFADINQFINSLKPGKKISFVEYDYAYIIRVADENAILVPNMEHVKNIEEFILSQEQYDEIMKFYNSKN